MSEADRRFAKGRFIRPTISTSGQNSETVWAAENGQLFCRYPALEHHEPTEATTSVRAQPPWPASPSRKASHLVREIKSLASRTSLISAQRSDCDERAANYKREYEDIMPLIRKLRSDLYYQEQRINQIVANSQTNVEKLQHNIDAYNSDVSNAIAHAQELAPRLSAPNRNLLRRLGICLPQLDHRLSQLEHIKKGVANVDNVASAGIRPRNLRSLCIDLTECDDFHWPRKLTTSTQPFIFDARCDHFAPARHLRIVQLVDSRRSVPGVSDSCIVYKCLAVDRVEFGRRAYFVEACLYRFAGSARYGLSIWPTTRLPSLALITTVADPVFFCGEECARISLHTAKLTPCWKNFVENVAVRYESLVGQNIYITPDWKGHGAGRAFGKFPLQFNGKESHSRECAVEGRLLRIAIGHSDRKKIVFVFTAITPLGELYEYVFDKLSAPTPSSLLQEPLQHVGNCDCAASFRVALFDSAILSQKNPLDVSAIADVDDDDVLVPLEPPTIFNSLRPVAVSSTPDSRRSPETSTASNTRKRQAKRSAPATEQLPRAQKRRRVNFIPLTKTGRSFKPTVHSCEKCGVPNVRTTDHEKPNHGAKYSLTQQHYADWAKTLSKACQSRFLKVSQHDSVDSFFATTTTTKTTETTAKIK